MSRTLGYVLGAIIILSLGILGLHIEEAGRSKPAPVPVAPPPPPLQVLQVMPVKGYPRTWLLVYDTLPLSSLTLDTTGMRVEKPPSKAGYTR